MNRNLDPREIVLNILDRSICQVQVGAVLSDNWGVYGIGWNHSGPDGMGLHAEIHCLGRSNRSRMALSTLYVAARRKRNDKIVTAKPCPACMPVVASWCGRVVYRDGKGDWIEW